MELGEKIKALRTAKLMTQSELAGNEITRNMLSRIENGAAQPSLDTLKYIAAKLNVSAGFLLAEAGDEDMYMKHNDIEMLKEMQLEFAGEGKSYASMIRCAIRWNDPSIISNLVAPKYGEHAAEMKPVIENQYFVPWDLNIK